MRYREITINVVSGGDKLLIDKAELDTLINYIYSVGADDGKNGRENMTPFESEVVKSSEVESEREP